MVVVVVVSLVLCSRIIAGCVDPGQERQSQAAQKRLLLLLIDDDKNKGEEEQRRYTM